MSDAGEITIRLSKAEALILFDLTSRVEPADSSIVPDVAEWHALSSLSCVLESVLLEPFMTDYADRLKAAKQELLERCGDVIE